MRELCRAAGARSAWIQVLLALFWKPRLLQFLEFLDQRGLKLRSVDQKYNRSRKKSQHVCGRSFCCLRSGSEPPTPPASGNIRYGGAVGTSCRRTLKSGSVSTRVCTSPCRVMLLWLSGCRTSPSQAGGRFMAAMIWISGKGLRPAFMNKAIC